MHDTMPIFCRHQFTHYSIQCIFFYTLLKDVPKMFASGITDNITMVQ